MAGKRLSKIRERLSQMRVAFTQTRQMDPRLVPLMAGIGGGVAVIVVVVGVLLGRPVFFAIFGVLLGVLAALTIFGRRAQRAALRQMEGRPGAAAAVLEAMRGPWIVTPAVAVTRKQDFVHRVVGRPGVVLVGEGSPARVRNLLRQEHRRVGRVVGDRPVHEISVGNGDGQVPLGKLQRHVNGLRKTMKAKQVGPLNTKLSALGDTDLPVPKGPMPRGKIR